MRIVGVAAFTEKDAYRLMLRNYPDVMSMQQLCDILHISTKTGLDQKIFRIFIPKSSNG